MNAGGRGEGGLCVEDLEGGEREAGSFRGIVSLAATMVGWFGWLSSVLRMD